MSLPAFCPFFRPRRYRCPLFWFKCPLGGRSPARNDCFQIENTRRVRAARQRERSASE